MPGSRSGLFSTELIDVIAQDRMPSVRELIKLARRIWADAKCLDTTAGWSRLPRTSPERVWSLRAACLALCGAVASAQDPVAAELRRALA
jgi:hypothetical protein